MEQYEYIKRLEYEMQSRYDRKYINICIMYANKLLNKSLPVIFDTEHIVKILQLHRIKLDYYSEFIIRGKKGKERLICAPSRSLKSRQRWILDNILYKINVSSCCEGFIKKHSTLTNAKKHVGYGQILNMDISDFFPSITEAQIENVFFKAGYTHEVSAVLAKICCHEEKLPQGAPTSPYLANIVCLELDDELMQYSKNHGIMYSRYADDMTFSGNTDMEKHVTELEEIIRKNGFHVNERKTHIYKGNQRKLVTGLIVKDDGLSVPRNFKRKLKQEIYYCKKFGVAVHLENTNAEKKVNFKEYLYGKAYYVKMVEPLTGQNFLEELNSINWG